MISCDVGQIELLDEKGLGWLAIRDGRSDYIIEDLKKFKDLMKEKTCIMILLWNKRMAGGRP